MLFRLPSSAFSAILPPIASFAARTRPYLSSLRSNLPPQQFTRAPSQQLFHTTCRLHDDTDSQNYYEILELTPNASPGQIKKQFYALSKAHHPDLHPTDPTAPKRFVRISTAYATLSSPAKRSAYDRDLSRSDPSLYSQGHGPRGGTHPTGSHSSAQAQGDASFGARPASGLSKRRGTFRGPPESFYRAGGWGQYAGKRKAAAEGGSHGDSSASDGAGGNGNGGRSTAGGFSPGQREGYGSDGDVPHFDREGHFRRQETVDERARIRRQILAERAERMQEGQDAGILGRLIIVSFALGVGILVAVYLPAETGKGESPKRGRNEGRERQS